MSDQKPPFIFNNYSLLCLFKLTITSPLINSCPMQKQKDTKWQHSLFLCSFLPAIICMCIFTLHCFKFLSAWKYMAICIISLLRAAMFFPVKKIILVPGAYALMFALRWVVIFIPIFTTLPPDLMITNIACGRHLFLPGASSRKCRMLFCQASCISSISTSLVIFIFGIFLRC